MSNLERFLPLILNSPSPYSQPFQTLLHFSTAPCHPRDNRHKDIPRLLVAAGAVRTPVGRYTETTPGTAGAHPRSVAESLPPPSFEHLPPRKKLEFAPIFAQLPILLRAATGDASSLPLQYSSPSRNYWILLEISPTALFFLGLPRITVSASPSPPEQPPRTPGHPPAPHFPLTAQNVRRKLLTRQLTGDPVERLDNVHTPPIRHAAEELKGFSPGWSRPSHRKETEERPCEK